MVRRVLRGGGAAFAGALSLAAVVTASGAISIPDAAMTGDRAAITTLLKQGADVNATQGDAVTALHWAARLGDNPGYATPENSATIQNFGTIVALAPEGITVAAMNSIAILTELQRPGGKRLAAADFLRGFDVQVGMRFDTAGGSSAPKADTPKPPTP